MENRAGDRAGRKPSRAGRILREYCPNRLSREVVRPSRMLFENSTDFGGILVAGASSATRNTAILANPAGGRIRSQLTLIVSQHPYSQSLPFTMNRPDFERKMGSFCKNAIWESPRYLLRGMGAPTHAGRRRPQFRGERIPGHRGGGALCCCCGTGRIAQTPRNLIHEHNATSRGKKQAFSLNCISRLLTRHVMLKEYGALSGDVVVPERVEKSATAVGILAHYKSRLKFRRGDN